MEFGILKTLDSRLPTGRQFSLPSVMAILAIALILRPCTWQPDRQTVAAGEITAKVTQEPNNVSTESAPDSIATEAVVAAENQQDSGGRQESSNLEERESTNDAEHESKLSNLIVKFVDEQGEPISNVNIYDS